MPVHSERNVEAARRTIERHNDEQGWTIDNPAHGLGMLLFDLIEYADAMGIDFDRELEVYRDSHAELIDQDGPEPQS